MAKIRPTEVLVLTDQVLMMLRDRTSDVVFGTLFLLVALDAWGIALMRRRSGVGVLIWLGALSALEARPLFPSLDDAGLLPHSHMEPCRAMFPFEWCTRIGFPV
jgi:hypothetical protein